MAVELTHIVAVMNETKQLHTLVFHSYDPRNLSTSCTLNQLLKESKIISIKKIQNSEIELSYEYGDLMICWKRKNIFKIICLLYIFTIDRLLPHFMSCCRHTPLIYQLPRS